MIALLFVGLAIISGVFPWADFRRRERIISWWSRVLLGTCGVTLKPEAISRQQRQLTASSEEGSPHDLAGEARGVADEPLSESGSQRDDPGEPHAAGAIRPTTGELLVCNHISWLDIFVVLALRPARFVAKIEIAAWPLIGRLVRGVGTLFIERGRRHAVHQLNERIEFTLNAGQSVAVFPEGTTSDGRRLLPFHANLLEPAVRSGAAVIPLGIRYLRPDGSPHEAVDFTGDTSLVGSMLRIFGSSRVMVQVTELPALQGANRHALAAEARAALARELGLPTDDAMPETLRRALTPASAPRTRPARSRDRQD